jgi:hypothetical protein
MCILDIRSSNVRPGLYTVYICSATIGYFQYYQHHYWHSSPIEAYLGSYVASKLRSFTPGKVRGPGYSYLDRRHFEAEKVPLFRRNASNAAPRSLDCNFYRSNCTFSKIGRLLNKGLSLLILLICKIVVFDYFLKKYSLWLFPYKV